MKFVWRTECERVRFIQILPQANEATLRFRWQVLRKRGACCLIQHYVGHMMPRKVVDTRNRLPSLKSSSSMFRFREHRFHGAAVPLGPDGLLQAGSCVVVNANQLAVEVDCAEEHTGVVRALVGFDMTCPADTQPIRDRQGMGIACVVPS